ncbi:hypothetical protein BH11ARM2_BH11ARM2_24370 [soil metagenome]
MSGGIDLEKTSSAICRSCGAEKATLASAQCVACARRSRKKARPLCECGCGQPCSRVGWKYASVKCQRTTEYRRWIERWKAGLEDGKNGLTVSKHIRRYLIEVRGEKSERCGWAERNSHTKLIPLTVDHIDGDWENNSADNLSLLCPNCHSLTPTYCGANRGHGRKARGAIRFEVSEWLDGRASAG